MHIHRSQKIQVVRVILSVVILLSIYKLSEDVITYQEKPYDYMLMTQAYEEVLITYMQDVLSINRLSYDNNLTYQKAIGSSEFEFFIFLKESQAPSIGYSNLSRYTGSLVKSPEAERKKTYQVFVSQIQQEKVSVVGFNQHQIDRGKTQMTLDSILENLRVKYPEVEAFYVGLRSDMLDNLEHSLYMKNVVEKIEKQIALQKMGIYGLVGILGMMWLVGGVNAISRSIVHKEVVSMNGLQRYLQGNNQYHLLFVGEFLVYLGGNIIGSLLLIQGKAAFNTTDAKWFIGMLLTGLGIWNVLGITRVVGCLREIDLMKDTIACMARGHMTGEMTYDTKIVFLEEGRNHIRKLEGKYLQILENTEKSEKLKTELLSRVSRDLQMPIKEIIEIIEVLKWSENKVEREVNYIAILEERARRLGVLLDELAEVEGAGREIGEVDLQPINLGDVAQKVIVQMQEKFCERGIKVCIGCDGESIVQGNENYLWRIIENLLSNAWKYAQENSEVRIEIQSVGEYVILYIENQTKECIEMNADLLIQRFVRGDKARHTEGFGLGLAIAKHFVELQRGKLNVAIVNQCFRVEVSLRKG